MAVPGALLQIGTSTAIGCGIGRLFGWGPGPALVLGLALAIASTAVATRALEDRRQLGSAAGQIALGWLVVQDLVVIVALVLLPVLADGVETPGDLLGILGPRLLGVAAFVAAVLLIGRRALPWLLDRTARMGSHELFTLSVIVVALGVAYGSATLFGVSLALGAFFAGVVLGESDLSHQAAAEALSVQSVFTVLFFVSVGMLFDPTVPVHMPLEVLAVLLSVVLGTGLVTLLMLLVLRTPPKTAAVVAGALAQIGEFSFILTELAVRKELFSQDGRDLVLTAALLAIIVNPAVVRVAMAFGTWLEVWPPLTRWREPSETAPRWFAPTDRLHGHAIIVGHGRVGRVVTAALRQQGLPYVVVEANRRRAEALRLDGGSVVYGDATRHDVFGAARPEAAQILVVALPDAFHARRMVELARAANPMIGTVVRAHRDEEVAFLTEREVGMVIMGEREIALSISDCVLRRLGMDAEAAQAAVDTLRSELPGSDGPDRG